jgi:hypothetical protein
MEGKMEKVRERWQEHTGKRGRRGLFSGLILVGLGAFWLLGRMEIVPEPAEIVIPGLVILTGLASIFRSRDRK